MTIAAFPAKDDRGLTALFGEVPCLRAELTEAIRAHTVLTDSPKEYKAAIAVADNCVICAGTPGPSGQHLLRAALRQAGAGAVVYAGNAWLEKLRRLGRFTSWTVWGTRDDEVTDETLFRLVRTAPAVLRGEPLADCRGIRVMRGEQETARAWCDRKAGERMGIRCSGEPAQAALAAALWMMDLKAQGESPFLQDAQTASEAEAMALLGCRMTPECRLVRMLDV